MNPASSVRDRARLVAWCLAIAGALLILGGLAWWVAERTRPPGLDEARADLRRKYLTELRAENLAAMTNYGWVDQTKGIVRLPVRRAVELTLQLGPDPAAGRSNLLSRLDKATAKPPPQPSEYE